MPQEITVGTSCSLDGMTLADFPGPKGQIIYTTGNLDYFCDTVEMFSIYLKPEQKKISQVYLLRIWAQRIGKNHMVTG